MTNAALRLLRLVQNQIRVGQPLPFNVRDEQAQLLLARGHVVASDAQLEALIERGAYVDIEEYKKVRGAPEEEVQQRKLTIFGVWDQMIWRVDRLIRSTDEPGFDARADDVARAFIALVQRDPDIGLYLANRQDPKRFSLYGLTHSMFTALAGCLVVQRMGWDEGRLVTLVKAALTMNMAIIELQGQLAVQGKKPNEQQQLKLRAHPQAAYDRLVAAGVTDQAWLHAVLHHHERKGGGGYPTGIAEPCEFATALRCVDVFMAKISPRNERSAIPIQEAQRQLFAESGGSALAATLIKEFGIYPPGEFVQLKSGELAVVVRRGAAVNTPLAAAITDRKGMPIVGTNQRDTSKAEFAITGPVRNHQLVLRVQPERLFGLPE